MPPRSMQDRLTLLEQRVSQLETATIPALREEMRAGFEDMRARFDAVGRRFESMDRRFEAIDRRFEGLEQRMEQGFEETRRHARVLYEDLVTRIAAIGEGSPAPSRRARRKT
jgi:hypothetical protein